LKFPHLHSTSFRYYEEGVEKPDLCLVSGFVHLNGQAELSDIQHVLKHLHAACLNYPAYGGIIGTHYFETDSSNNHAYVMTVDDGDWNYFICSYGRCSPGSFTYPLGFIGKLSELRGLEFVLFCEKHKQLGIDLHLFGNILYDFQMPMMPMMSSTGYIYPRWFFATMVPLL
jgi:hypothetical protein